MVCSRVIELPWARPPPQRCDSKNSAFHMYLTFHRRHRRLRKNWAHVIGIRLYSTTCTRESRAQEVHVERVTKYGVKRRACFVRREGLIAFIGRPAREKTETFFSSVRGNSAGTRGTQEIDCTSPSSTGFPRFPM